MKPLYRFMLKFYYRYTFDEDKFKNLINDAIKERKNKIIQTNSLELTTNNRIAEALKNSSFISSIFFY